jgi:hypothetical protein
MDNLIPTGKCQHLGQLFGDAARHANQQGMPVCAV